MCIRDSLQIKVLRRPVESALGAPVRVEHDLGRQVPAQRDGHGQGVLDQVGAHVLVDGQPITRREWASMTVARYSHPCQVRRYVMSPTQTRFRPPLSQSRFAASTG